MLGFIDAVIFSALLSLFLMAIAKLKLYLLALLLKSAIHVDIPSVVAAVGNGIWQVS